MATLPEEIRQRARNAYALFAADPSHPSLRFKKVGEPNVYSVRITRNYRALGLLDGDSIVWFCIGSHADYDRLLDTL